MCLAMNADRLEPGERCASTTNRNFEGRQGAGGRTHLVSPAMAAAAAIAGHSWISATGTKRDVIPAGAQRRAGIHHTRRYGSRIAAARLPG